MTTNGHHHHRPMWFDDDDPPTPPPGPEPDRPMIWIARIIGGGFIVLVIWVLFVLFGVIADGQ